MIQEIRSKRPFKIWDSWRNVRKGLVVSNFEELVHRGENKYYFYISVLNCLSSHKKQNNVSYTALK